MQFKPIQFGAVNAIASLAPLPLLKSRLRAAVAPDSCASPQRRFMADTTHAAAAAGTYCPDDLEERQQQAEALQEQVYRRVLSSSVMSSVKVCWGDSFSIPGVGRSLTCFRFANIVLNLCAHTLRRHTCEHSCMQSSKVQRAMAAQPARQAPAGIPCPRHPAAPTCDSM